MKISVILTFLLSWSFVSSNPHQKTSNDKSVSELNHENDSGSDSSNLARTESSDDASSGKDWGGDISKFLSQMENMETLTKLFANQEDRETEESTFVDEKTKKHGNRGKRDLRTLDNPYKGSISEHLLRLSEGSTGNVLRSKQATVAEALNGRAIDRILQQARAKAARVAPRKDLYNSDDFGKWLLSGSSFDTNIFHHHRPSLDAKVEENSDTSENTDNLRHRTFSTWHTRAFDPNRHHHRRHHRHHEGKREFSTLFDLTAADTADTEHAYAKLLHKSKRRERLSPKLQITSGEERSRDETDGTFPTTVSRHAHKSLSYEDDTADDTRSQYYLYSYAPYRRLRVTEDEDMENDMPRWRRTKWIHRFGARAPHSADSLEFESPEETDDYKKWFIFGRTFDGFGDEEVDDEGARVGRREGHKISSGMDVYDKINRDSPDDEETPLSDSQRKTKLGRERYYYGIEDREHSVYDSEADDTAFGGTKNRHSADFLAESTLSADSRGEKNIRNENKHLGYGGVERSAVYSAASAETTEEVAGEESGNVLTTKISTDTPEARKAVNIDIERYHSGDRNAAVNSATSLSSSLLDEKGSERTNNALTSPSVDDGSAVARKATKNGNYGVLQTTRSVIDNDATAAEIEMGFNGIKSHPRADLPWAYSPLPRARSKTHLGNQKAHRSISGYGRSAADAIASTETKRSMDSGGDARLKRVKTQKTSAASEYENYDLRENEEVSGDAESSAEATSSDGSDLLRTASSDDSREEDLIETRKDRVDLNEDRRTIGQHETSIEVMDIPDQSDEAYILIPEFQAYKFRRGRWPHDVNYYPNSEETRSDQEIEVGRSARNWGEHEINYDNLEREGRFSADDETSERSITAISARRSDGGLNRYRQRGKYDQRSRYDYDAFNQFLRNMTWLSSVTISSMSEYEAWERYIAYLYYLWKQNGENSDTSTFATEENKEKNDTMEDKKISWDRRERQYMTDKDNQIHLKKHKKWLHRAGKFMIKNAPGLVQDKIKLNQINNGKKSNDEEGEAISDDNENNTNENHKTFTKNVIREDSAADVMSKTRNNKEIIDNNSYRRQDSWNSQSLENSYADVQTETNDAYDSHRRNENVDMNIKQITGTTESAENKPRYASTKTSSTSHSDMESQMNEHTVNKSDNIKKIVNQTQTLGKKDEYQDENDLRDTSLTSSESIDESQTKRMHHLREKSRIDQKNSASMETLIETISSGGATDKYRSNIQDTAASKLSGVTQAGSEYYLENLKEHRKYSTNAGASEDMISAKDKQESILKDASSFSKSSLKSETDVENYSSENAENIQIDINSGASSAMSSKTSAKSGAKTEQTRDDFRNVQMNANNAKASSTVIISDNMQNKWSTSKLFEESREKSNYLTNNENNQINAISRASADSTLSDTIEDERQSHLQRSFSSSSSTSSEKLQAESQHNSNSIQNSQMNVAAMESSMKSTSTSSAENGHWSDSSKSSSSSKSLEEVHQHSSNDVIKTQENNIEHRSELESSSISESHVESKLKDEHYLNVTERNEKNVNAGASSKTTNTISVKDNHQQESISSSSSSYSSAESQVTNGNIKTSASNTISSNIVNDTDQHSLLRVASSSQTANKSDLKVQEEDRQTIKKSTTLETDINDDKRGRKNNTLKATEFIDPKIKNNIKLFTDNKIIGKGETVKEDSKNVLDATTSATAVTFIDTKNIQNSITMSSLRDSKAETRLYNENLNKLKENETVTDSAISRIYTTSGTSSEIGHNDKKKLLETSLLSESHSTSAEERRRDMDSVQNIQESMATAKASSESTVSSNNIQLQNEYAEESTSSESFKETRQKQRNFNIHQEKSESTASGTTLEATSNNGNEYSVEKGASSVASYNKLQTDKWTDENGTNDKYSTENAILRNNEYKRLKHVSPYDYRDKERIESKINSRNNLKYQKDTNEISGMISTGSITSTTLNNANRNNLMEVKLSDNLQTKSLQENEDKSNIHSDAEIIASTGITSDDDKPGNTLRKLILLSNLSDEAQMTHGDNYNILNKFATLNGDKKFKQDNLWKMLSSDKLRWIMKNKNIEDTEHTEKSVKDATGASTSTDTSANFKDDCQDDPMKIPIANIQNESQNLKSAFSTNTEARSEIDHKSKISKESEIINTETRDMYDINKWHGKYQSTASSSSHTETRAETEDASKTEVSTKSITDQVNENSHEGDSIREKSFSASSSFHNYSERERADMGKAVEVKASAETSISDLSSIKYRDDVKKEASAISRLERHDLNAREEDKAIASGVPLPAGETKFNRMQNTQQPKLAGSVTSSNSRTEVQQGKISDIAKEDLEVTASATMSAQTTSSETVESESREKLMGIASKSHSYAKSQEGSKYNLNEVSQEEQIIATAEASANSVVSRNLQNVRQSDWLKKDSLSDSSRNTYAKIENKNVLENNIANAASVTMSAKETGYGVIKDKRQSGETIALLSSSRAEAQEQHGGNSDVQQESIETTSSDDTKDRILKTENIVNSRGANLKAAANSVTSTEAIFSSGVQDSSKILSSANSHAESRVDNTHTLNAAGMNSQEAAIAKASAASLASTSVGEEKHTDYFMKEKLIVDSQIQRMSKTKSENTEASGQTTSFINVKDKFQGKDEHEAKILQEQHLISTDSAASSIPKTFAHTDNIQENNLEELTTTSSSNSYAKSGVANENRVDVLAKDYTDVSGASASTQTMTSNKFGNMERDESLQATSSSDARANAQAVDKDTGTGKDSSAVVSVRTETATSADTKSTDHGLSDLLTGAATGMRTKGETISQEGVVKGDLSGTSPDVFSAAGVEDANAKMLTGNNENSVIAIAETGNGDQRDQQGNSREMASSFSSIQDSQFGINQSTSLANSYAAAQTTSESTAKDEKIEEDPGVNISTSGAAQARSRVTEAQPSGWLVTTSDDATVAEERAQNKDKLNVLREVEEVAVYAGTSAGANARNIEGEQRNARTEKPGECQGGSNVATTIRNAGATSGASAETTVSMETKNESENESILNGEITAPSFDEANVETRISTEGESSVSRNSESSVSIEEMQSSASAASSASTSDNLDMNDRARYYYRIVNGMPAISAIIPGSDEVDLSSGEITVLYPSHEMSKCDENVETREFISEATSLYQMLDKRGSEILLMKKNPRGPVQIASLKDSVPPLVMYQLIPQKVYERIRAIIANKQILCVDCAALST